MLKGVRDENLAPVYLQAKDPSTSLRFAQDDIKGLYSAQDDVKHYRRVQGFSLR